MGPEPWFMRLVEASLEALGTEAADIVEGLPFSLHSFGHHGPCQH